jgi:serine/threonine protein phosphatase 1
MKRLFPWLRRAPSAPRVDEPVWVIGDIHGRRDLLESLLDRLDRQGAQARPVAVGDLVDRGPDSRGVLDVLMARPGAVSLRGNHEDMLLDFLDRPAEAGPIWLRNGGDATLESFDVALPGEETPAKLEAVAFDLRAMLGPRLEWLKACPLLWRTGDLVVAHAGLAPGRAPEDQDPRDVLWGHPRFRRRPRRDGLWVAHGHWVMEAPQLGRGRIALDTGAWFSDVLTGVLFEPGRPPRFVHS